MYSFLVYFAGGYCSYKDMDALVVEADDFVITESGEQVIFVSEAGCQPERVALFNLKDITCFLRMTREELEAFHKGWEAAANKKGVIKWLAVDDLLKEGSETNG